MQRRIKAKIEPSKPAQNLKYDMSRYHINSRRQRKLNSSNHTSTFVSCNIFTTLIFLFRVVTEN